MVKKKQILNYVAVFLLGVVVTYGTLVSVGATGEGRLSRNSVSKYTVQQNVPKSVGTQICNATNCDIMDELAKLKGSTSWSLQGLAQEVANSRGKVISGIAYELEGLKGSSSWSLQGLAQEVANARGQVIGGVAYQLEELKGNSSWTIQGLAEHIAYVCK